MSDPSQPDDTILSSSHDANGLATLRVTQAATAAPADDDSMATLVVAKSPVTPTQTPPLASANPDAKVPVLFGRRIAQGGMGAILEAQDCKLGRTIAVKIMLSEAGCSEDQKQRFIQEAAVLGRLEHPNIVPIYDLGRDEEGQLFYTMKLVKGRTLQDILDDLRHEHPAALRHYTLDRLLTIFRKVCDALAFAHAQNIIHRDLKPENIMVGEFGEVLVMDWGIAKILGEKNAASTDASARPTAPAGTGSFTATMDGAVMGTPNYMSPEQAMGRMNEMDARSDIFSLGGILYCILTLRPPVEGKDVREVLEKVSSANITAPTTFGATTGKGKPGAKGEVLEAKKITPLPHVPAGRVPPALSAVAMKALTLDKAKRYQDIAAFSTDIEAYQGGFATSAEQAGLAKQLVLLIKRHKGIFITSFVAWLLITALGVWFMFNLRAKEQFALAEADRATKAEASTRQALAKASLSLAEAALREANGPEMQIALHNVPEDLRDTTWRYLLAQSDSAIARIDTESAQLNSAQSGSHWITSAAAHPRRASVFAVADLNNRITLLNLSTGKRLLQFAPAFPLKSRGGELRIAFSPDGERIAVGRDHDGDGNLVIHDAQDGKKLQEWVAPGSWHLEFSPDGKRLLQCANSGKPLIMWDTAKEKRCWTHEFYDTGALTPDGQQIVTYNYQNGLQIVHAMDGRLLRQIGGRGDKATVITLSPDGKLALVGTSDGVVKGWNLLQNTLAFEFRAQNAAIRGIAFTPDGTRFVTGVTLADGRQAIQIWDSRTAAPLQSLLGGSGNIQGHDNGIGAHPLSGELLVTGPHAHTWNLTGTPEKWSLRGEGNHSIAFWGSDDMAFLPLPGHITPLHKLLENGSTTFLWRPTRDQYRGASVSADGRFAAIGPANNTGNETNREKPILLLRNPGTNTEQVTTFDASSQLDFLRLSPHGDRLIAAYGTWSRLDYWDTATGTQPIKLEHEGFKDEPGDFIWLGEGQRLVGLVTAKAKRGLPDSEERVVLWDATTGKILKSITHRTAMNVLAAAPDGRRFAEAGVDKMVRIRDAETLAVQHEFRAHDGPITALAWHPSKPVLVTASTDLNVRIWNLDTGLMIEEMRGPLAAPHELAFSPGGRRLGCAAKDGITRIWEPQSLNEKTVAEEAPRTHLKQDADGWEDALAPLTSSYLRHMGNGWLMYKGALLSPNKLYASLPIPGDLSNTSYQVRLKLRQLNVERGFHLDFPVSDRMVGFDLDAWPAEGHYTGLNGVNGLPGKDVPGNVRGKQLPDSDWHILEISVHMDGLNSVITSKLDDQPLHQWTGLTSTLSQYKNWSSPAGLIALGTNNGEWSVSEVKVKRAGK